MARVSAKLRSMDFGLGTTGYGFWCPGCQQMHAVPTAGTNAWGFDGNLEAPTFTPSILVRGVVPLTDEQHARVMAGEKIQPTPLVCHSFVRAGRMEFCGDCTHPLNGQTVPLPDLPAAYLA